MSGRSTRALAITLLSTLGAAIGVIACGGGEAAPDSGTVAESPPAAIDAGRPDSGPPRPIGPPKRIFAKRFVINVRARPDREAPRIGYLRAGAVLQATTSEPVSVEGCRGGWFELTTGGFVCNGSDVIAFEGRRLPEKRPAQPDFEAPLPYKFARTRRDGTPMYRRLPSDDEAAVHEGYRIPGIRVEQLPDGGLVRHQEVAVEEIPPPEAQPAVAREPDPVVAVAPEPTEPDPVVTLDQLQGDRGSVVMRRLAKGFIVSLDRDMRVGARRYWRTLSNGFVPYFSQVEVRGSEFRGQELRRPVGEGETADETRMALPIGFVTSSKTTAYVRGRDGRPRRGRPPGYHHVLAIVGEETHRDRRYVVAADGALFERDDVRILEAASDPPPEIGLEDRWIEVDLARQSLIAYEGRTPVYATLVSTGRVRDPDDPLRDMRTPTGLFRVTSKHVTHTMDGDHAVDGPYSIEDVPYVMYFQLAYALHSAFWHDGFGRPRSHGCVNLAPQDARWIFRWATPSLPEGWHGAYPTESAPGTWVWIHGETPEG